MGGGLIMMYTEMMLEFYLLMIMGFCCFAVISTMLDLDLRSLGRASNTPLASLEKPKMDLEWGFDEERM